MKYKNLLVYLLLGILLFIFLQSTYKFHFYHLEQYQLFLFDSSYISETIQSEGGLSLLISEFLTQFYIHPYAGAIITSISLTLVGLTSYGIIRKIDREATTFVLFSLLPVVTLLFMHYNFNYLTQGTIAYLVMLAFFYSYLFINKFALKLIFAIISVFLLFWWGGSIAVLFAISLLLKELFEKPSQSHWFIIPCLEVLLLAYGSVRFGLVGDYRFAFLPDMYFHPSLKPTDFSLYYSWICLPAILLFTYILRNKKSLSGIKLAGSIVLQIGIIAVIFWMGNNAYGDTRSLKFKEMEYYYRTQQWDSIIDMNKGKISNYLYACMLNVALAEKGELADKMFNYTQLGEQGLFVPWNRTHAISMLLSDINYTIGNTGAAQCMAFEANISAIGKRTGRMTERLVKTNLIYGEYAVAEKYIDLLEKTHYYSDWAKEQRKYLYNDKEIDENTEYSLRRKSLPNEEYLFTTNITDQELLNLAISNPANKNPIEYAGAMYLLTKRLDLFENLISTYYSTDVMPILPLSFQEALIILNENNQEIWQEIGISEGVINRFNEYKRLILTNKSNQALPQLVQNTYGKTYWYYYMFK